MTRCCRHALSVVCIALASLAAHAAEADTHGQPSAPTESAAGLRAHAVPGTLTNSALVDFALPRPAFLGGTRLGVWAQQAADLRDRLLPSWRSLGGEARGHSSGMRASAGIVNVTRATAFGAGLGEQAVIEALPSHRLSRAGSALTTASAPYLGIGWHDTPAANSADVWAFNADIGVMALAPRSTVRFGRTPGGPLTLDDMARDLRLTPLLQFGVTYTF